MANSFTLTSTLLLTLLLLVGLFFFVKASVKERTQEVELLVNRPEDVLLSQLQQYFLQRAYRVIALDPEQEQVTFEGVVRPSVFLAIFLGLLVATGLLCLGLVLSILVPQIAPGFLGLVLLAPLASWFYWQQARRPEKVVLKVDAIPGNTAAATPDQTRLRITAHRDELISLQTALQLEPQP